MSRTQGNRDQHDFEPMDAPRDPALAGFVGKRRASYGEPPNPDGNRDARRAHARLVKRQARKAR